MFSVKAKETMKIACQGMPAVPQFTVYKDRTYTVAEKDDTTQGTMPDWVAKAADRLDILELIEEIPVKKEKPNRQKQRRVEE